jgi:hypothetical protein
VYANGSGARHSWIKEQKSGDEKKSFNLENNDCAYILRIRKHHPNGCHGGVCVVCGNEKS